jgi:tetrahydromethanopterin S-methyltransferase subunit D
MEQADGAQALGFKDRKAGLLVFGILQITLGGAGAVLMFFATINIIASPILKESPARPVSAAALAIWYFCAGAFLAVWSVWTGVGSIKARRWARVLILASSWIELIGMICQFVLQLLLTRVPRGESVFTMID